jgi:4-alpha-glucanotransferase
VFRTVYTGLPARRSEKEPQMNDLTDAARHWGIDSEYYDVFGHRYSASPETLTRLIAAISAGHAAPQPLDAPAEPLTAFQGDGRREWALAVQLYALRSRRNWGHGDFTDLAQLIALAGKRGAAGIGLNPLHALFIDRAEEASPYAPNSRLFLNPLYIDVEAIAEFPGLAAAGLTDAVEALRATETVAYARVAAAKLHGLRLAYDRFRRRAGAARRDDFAAYRAEQGEALLCFACFEVLRRRYAEPWPQWPEPWRKPTRAQLDEFHAAHAVECGFHEFMQWVADRQLASCVAAARRAGMPIGLYADLAVGIDPHGADAWSQQDAVLAGVSMGAPPDEYNPQGQDWGLAPLNPHALAEGDFASVRQLMRAAMRHAGAVRLDHVLGLNRVFMVPRGLPAAQGAYMHFPFQQLLRVIAEESLACRCIVVGEDLGTVPEHFRDTVARWGLWGYRVVLFEREHDGRFKPPEAYPAEAVATFNTHDMPSFRGWLSGHDLVVKRGIGVDPGESDEARAWAQQMLRAMLTESAGAYAPDDFAAVATFLGTTPSRLAVVALDDVAGVLEQINIPGTVTQHPNWRRKLPMMIEELDRHAGFARVAEAFAKAGRSTAS